MKVAIVGTGISGLTVAHRAHPHHELTLFEAGASPGGHTATVDVEVDGRSWAVDTGFIVFNSKTYPNFLALLEELGVEWLDTTMGFSVKSEKNGLEYNGTTVNSLFAQRSNIFRPRFWRMVKDILRFYREARELLAPGNEHVKLGPYLREKGYSKQFVEEHLNPMGAAVWSASAETMEQFPAAFFLRFFENHGFLEVNERPTWRVVKGGSREYMRKMIRPFEDRIRVNTPVTGLRRDADGVELFFGRGESERFDEVVLACHAPQALEILGSEASEDERQVLSLFKTQPNKVALHTDMSLLPKRPLARAAWNVRLPKDDSELVRVTYWMNDLMRLPSDAPSFLVTLNEDDTIDDSKVLRRFVYSHPIFTPEAIQAQSRHAEISGADRVHFCGAYWRNGFHEDGHVSGLTVANALLPEREHVIPRPIHKAIPVTG